MSRIVFRHGANAVNARVRRDVKCGGGGGGGAGSGVESGVGSEKVLSVKTINPGIVKLEYAVRGPLMIRAGVLVKELEAGAKLPFTKVIRANLGDAQAMGQKPITFVRQMVSSVAYPEIMTKMDIPDDVKERASLILDNCGGRSAGAYSNSLGIELIRKHVSAHIKDRDGGHPVNYTDVCVVAGASAGIKFITSLFCNNPGGKPSGIMIPIPQYPLYSAIIDELHLVKVPYYLDEDNQWALDVAELERAYEDGMRTSEVRVLVIINPGNPTGQVLSKKNVESVIKFALEKRLFVFADEVYQMNIHGAESKFYSFKKVMHNMGEPYTSLELVSFVTASKGYVGECGMRAGWMEMVNMDPQVQAHLYKLMSANLCPSVLGQVVTDCLAMPPKQGDASYKLWDQEVSDIHTSLKERAAMVYESFNKMKGFKCNIVQGAMYAFPRVDLPRKAIEAARRVNKKPDVFYAFRLLEETGICVVPGSGFGQKKDTYHFRTTILPQTPLLKEMLQQFERFHDKFTKEFS